MQNPENQSLLADPARREDWFLEQLEAESLPVEVLFQAITVLARDEIGGPAGNWAEMLQETLAKRQMTTEGLRLMALRLEKLPIDPANPPAWDQIAVMALGGTRDARTLADQAGFGKHPPRECVRRLQVLLALKPGVLCYDRTWGFGVVKSTDVFYARVEIDFERRQAHQMSMAYAAEVVQILDDDHLLSRRHRDPAAMQALIRDNPAEVVRIALRSFGPLNVAQLQERLTPSLIPEAGWKSFWEGARKGLKSDPLVHLPAKRTDPIQLLAKAKAFDEDWVAALIAERDMEQVLAKVEALLEDPASLGSLPPNGPAAVGQRLAFVVKGASYRQPGLPVRAAMLAVPARVPAEIVDAASIARAGLAGDAMLKVLADLPARLVGPYFAFLAATDRDTTLQRLLELLPRFEVGCLSEAIAFLIAAGKEAECAALLRESVTARVAPVEFMFWVLRNPQMIEKWNLGPLSVIGELALDELEKDYSGVRLRAQNQLRERFEQKEWLKACFSDMRDAKRREMLQRIRGTPAWPAVDRQSVMGHIVKLFPELADVLVSKSEARPGARGPVTSERTYRERQALLEKIANVEIPRIAREIGVARSYGDLRENFEFKAAKEQQGLLLRRKAELEQMLHDVRPTDFSGLPTDKAGLATAVRLAYPDGHEEQFYLLGEWDSDEKRGIISCTSKLARDLEGKAPGDRVTMELASGPVECTIAAVSGLPPEIMAWARGEDVAGGNAKSEG